MRRKHNDKDRATDRAYQRLPESKARAAQWALDNPEKRRETERRYRAKNRAKITAQKRIWRKANPEKHNAANARWKINRRLRLCDFDALLLQQSGKCAICLQEDAGRSASGRLAIDHDHSTGKVRGLLCHRCNSMLGLAKDNPETLLRAIAYLGK